MNRNAEEFIDLMVTSCKRKSTAPVSDLNLLASLFVLTLARRPALFLGISSTALTPFNF